MAKILKTNIDGEAIYKVASDFEIDNFEIFQANGDELFDETSLAFLLCQYIASSLYFWYNKGSGE